MDRIFKFLSKRKKKDRLLLIDALDLIVNGQTNGLDIKKLKGKNNHFRVRVSRFRIIFKKVGSDSFVMKIDERNDRTYK